MTPKDGRGALVRYAGGGRSLDTLTARGRALVHRVPEPMQLGIKRFSRRSAIVTLEIFAGLAIVGLLILALVYGRLNQGPISLAFLVKPIERAVNGELSGHSFHIGGAVVRKAESGPGIEFRLKDVRLLNAAGDVVAEAPQAAVDLSLRALLALRLTAGQIDLIGPRLFLHFSEDQGLSFSVAGAAAGGGILGNDAAARPAGALLAADPPPPRGARRDGQRINVSDAVNEIFSQVNQTRSASSYLTGFGIRDAEVYFDHGEGIAAWRVPSLKIDLVRQRKRSLIIGEGSISSGTDSWRFGFRAQQKRKNGRLSLEASVFEVEPRSMAAAFPSVDLLKVWGLPVTAVVQFDMMPDGAIVEADARIQLADGAIHAPWNEEHPVHLDAGDIRLKYTRKDGRLEVLSSLLSWGDSYARVSGVFQSETIGEGRRVWLFRLGSDDIALAAADFHIPAIRVDDISAQGYYDAGAGRVMVDLFQLRAADASIALSGTVTQVQGAASPRVMLQGTISAMPVAFVKLIWPKFIAPGARAWIGERITAGKITGGALRVDVPEGMIAALAEGGELPGEAVSFRLDLSDLAIHPIAGLPPLRTGKATAMVLGQRFILDVPDSAIALPSGERIAFTGGQMIIGDLRQDRPVSEVHFKAAGTAQGVLDLLDHEPLGYIRALNMTPPAVGGAVSSAFSLTVPLLSDLKFKDMRMNGRARLEEARAPALFEGLDVQDGAISFDVSEKALEAHGDLRVNGVPLSLAWQRIFDAPPDRQPALRLRGTLDNALREQVGLKVNHIVQGATPFELTATPVREGAPRLHLEVNLTNSDIFLTNMGWRKAPGQAALLNFDIGRTGEGGARLDNFAITGDDLAIRGSVTLDGRHRPVAFRFPHFSLNILSQMALSGQLGDDNVWKIRASGSSYDGRRFFRALFSAGKLAEDQPGEPEGAPGLDVHAEFGTVVGYFDTTVKNVTIDARRRNDRLVFLDAYGRLNGVAPVAARVEIAEGQPRYLLAEATDAGAAFRLVGLYPSARGGEASLRVNLDGLGEADQIGTLYANNFVVVGDQVVGEVLAQGPGRPEGRRARTGAGGGGQYTQIQFDRMRVPFSVGHGQFVLHDSSINGPLLGATMRGRIDFKSEEINISGTYVPLYGLNAALGAVPILGDLLTGRRGEGIFGITFAVQGPSREPDVLVNPVSVVAPGFLRQIFEFDQTPPEVIPPEQRQQRQKPGARASRLSQ